LPINIPNLVAHPEINRSSGCPAVEYVTLEWVDWFNHRRLLEPIGNIPPAEAEEQYYAAAANIDMAA
jgi:hypothetical protein